jgi:hypothetical protein
MGDFHADSSATLTDIQALSVSVAAEDDAYTRVAR